MFVWRAMMKVCVILFSVCGLNFNLGFKISCLFQCLIICTYGMVV